MLTKLRKMSWNKIKFLARAYKLVSYNQQFHLKLTATKLQRNLKFQKLSLSAAASIIIVES
jgi:hypothetical protein